MTIKIYPRAEKNKKEEILEILDPLVREWFFSRFSEFSESQLYGVIPIWKRKNILISSPTGSGKTLTAFLSILNYLIILARKKELEDKIYCVYISPLKALNNDIFVNLLEPLKEIKEIAQKKGIELQEIRINVRTGDTKDYEKTKMLKKPPHIFITTPEGFAISLATKKFSNFYYFCEFVIVDEIHSLCNKRGVFLSLFLEKLEEISKISPVRIGLSATISPIDEIANFLVGENRECLISEVKGIKKINVEVITGSFDLIDKTTEKIQSSLYKILDEIIQNQRTSLIFTNTRSGTERVVNHLKENFPEKYLEVIAAHHSSLSKEYRFEVEEKLRKGELKAVVCSTSLELGIDIGYIDLVILLGSPKSSTRAIQRIGRAGHKLHDISFGKFVVLDRDDLVECSVIAKEVIENKIDKINIPKNCLDVLCQFIVGICLEKNWKIDEILNLIKRSYCYCNLSKEDFMSVISYLAGEYALEHKKIYAKIWYDEKTKMIGKKGKMIRVIYMTNLGTIPEESFVSVEIGVGENKGKIIGVVDEGFLEKIKIGDVFVLGGKKYQYLYSRGMKIYVKEDTKRNPNIPSWFSEMLPLSFDSALEIAKFRKLVNEKFEKNYKKEEIIEFIKEYCYCNEKVAIEIYNYFFEQYNFLKIPHLNRLLIEYYKSSNKNYVIFHSLFGRRVNDCISRALGYLMSQKTKRDIEIGISDNGFYFAGEKLPVDEALKFLNSKNLREVLNEAILKSEILKRRFRHCATRAFMILKNYKGKTKSVGLRQMRSFFLISAVNKISKDFPILKEAKREVLEDLMDIENAKKVIEWIKEGVIKIEKIETKIPSPFALKLVLQGYLDILKVEDKYEFMKRVHEEIIKEIEKKRKN